MKRILMIAYTYYESDPRVIREAEAAVEAGFDVHFLALRRPGSKKEEVINGVQVHRLAQAKHRGRGRIRYLWAYAEFFLRCLTRMSLSLGRRYRVIHVNNMPDMLVFSAILPKMLGSKVILDIHDPMPNTFVSKFKGQDGSVIFRLLLWQERLSAAFSDRVITVHEPVKSGILEKHGLASEAITVIANFPDQKVFAPQEQSSTDEIVHLVFHGTILERSGLRVLVDAVAGVRDKSRLRVKIIGEGDFSATLKDMIRDLGLENVVEFDNQSYPVGQIPGRIRDCNVGVVPLTMSSVTNYALPLKLLEYMSMGLPVISVKNAAICHYFTQEDCIFFDADQPSSLTAAIEKLIENPEIVTRYRRRSLELRRSFSWNSEKTKYIELLHALSGGAKA